MKLVRYSVTDQPPIKKFAIDALSDVVVFAGPNGVGKTRLLNYLLNCFRNPGSTPGIQVVVQSTSLHETQAWGGRVTLDTTKPDESKVLRSFLQRGKKRGQLSSGVLNFDSQRTLEAVRPYSFSWSFLDPYEEEIVWDYTFQPARSRFQDVVHSLHRKLRSQKEEIASRALDLQKKGAKEMPLDFEDPLERFKDIFRKLVPGKELCDLNEQTQQLTYKIGESPLPFESLSSGELEVVTVVFDFLLRNPQDCIIVFDEPELHLHPELSYRLLRTLREVGLRNQFLFCTHSPDIITASLDQSVIFVAPPDVSDTNQAIVVREDDEMARVLSMLGHSVGVISLGKRLVLVEGDRASLDKQVYGSIVGNEFPDLVIVPVGGKETISSFQRALDTVLTRTIWGVEFFMLADGDSAAASPLLEEFEQRSKGRLKLLPRYHLENYFLYEDVLANLFASIEEPTESWLRDPKQIRLKMHELAQPFISYAVALRVAQRVRLQVGNADIMPSECTGRELQDLLAAFETRRTCENGRISAALDQNGLAAVVESEYRRVKDAFERDDNEWRRILPGRPILSRFANVAKFDVGRLKRLYIRVAKDSAPDPFAEIRDIFSYFEKYSG
jgi:hypothetical protein